MAGENDLHQHTCESPESCIEKGHCAVHGVEIERRKQTTKTVAELKESMAACQTALHGRINRINERLSPEGSIGSAIDRSGRFRFGAWVAASILCLIFFASFMYTDSHIDKSDRRFEILTLDIDKRLEMMESETSNDLDILATELVSENDKFNKLLNNQRSKVNHLEIEIRLTTDRYNRIISDMQELKTMLLEIMKTKHEELNNVKQSN